MNNPAGQGGAGRATKDPQCMLTQWGVLFSHGKEVELVYVQHHFC